MNLNLEIGFEQLLRLVLQLPAKQRKQLVDAIEKAGKQPQAPGNFQELLLNGPVWEEEEYQQVLKTRELLNQLAANDIN